MLSALSFLTILGKPKLPDHRTLAWFPVVGAFIGLLLAGVSWLVGLGISSRLISAGLVVLADLTITGMLHFDGLADSADGLLPHLDRKRRLEVMRTPDVGAFALTLVPVILGLRWFSIISNADEWLMFVGIWMLSRTLMATAPAWIPYAHDQGIVTPFLAGARKWFIIWFIPAAILLASVDVQRGPLAIGLAVLAGTAVLGLAFKKIHGFTGDVLGAAAVIAETVALIVMAR